MEGWSLRRAAADPRLAGLVVGYVGFRERGPSLGPRLEVPTTQLPLILSLGRGMRIDGAALDGFGVGPHDAPSICEHDGDQDGIEIDLTPLGARRLYGLPLCEVRRLVVPAPDLLGTTAGELVAGLREAAWPERVALLDAFLLRRLAAAAPVAPALTHAWSLLEASGGTMRVDELARTVGWSRRRLSERFASELGLPPKPLAGVLRFQRACDRLRGGMELAEAAAASGYADQPHLNRDFRAFARTTPTAYLAALVPSVQDVAVGAP